MTGFVDWIAGGTKRTAKILLAFIVVSVVGGLLAGFGDVLLGSMLAGTPLGPGSRLSPLAWTALAAAVLFAVYGWKK